MNYRRRNKKIFFIIIFLIIILFFGFLKISWPQQIVKNVSAPIVNVKNFFFSPFKNLITTFKDKKELENKVKELEEELNKTKIALISKQSINTTNIADADFQILSRPPYSLFDTLLISKNNSNLNIGDLVFFDNVYIGEIFELSENTASVKLKSLSGEKTVVRVGGIDGEAQGLGGGQFLINIPKDLEVEIGDVVVVPELNNILIGVVGSVEQDSTGTFQNIRFSIPISFQGMDFVQVLKREDVLKLGND